MGAIRFSGMASGLPPNIVDQLMEAERIPVKTIEANKAKSEEKLKLVKDLETKVGDITKNIGELAGSRGFSDFKFITGDPNVIGGVVDPKTVQNGSWSVEVDQLAQKPGAVSCGFPDKDTTQLGVGYLKFDTPEGTKEVYLNGNNNTLEKAVATINASNVGMRAMVINDRKDKENPYRLLVTGLQTGDDKQVAFPTVYLLDGDQDVYFDESRPAQNGIIKVDGFEMQVSDNNVTDLIPGVTLDLKSAAPGRPINVSVKEDQEVISGKVKSFVDAVNGVLSFIQAQNNLNEKSDTSKTLGGDGMLRSIESRLRQVLQGGVFGTGSNISQLSEIGIAFNRNGTLTFDQQKFNASLASNAKGVQMFLGGDGFSTGFIPQIKRTVGDFLNIAYGAIPNRKQGLQKKIDEANHRIEDKERQLVRKEESLRNKFAKLEETMSKLQSQGQAVGGMVGGLQQTGGGKG